MESEEGRMEDGGWKIRKEKVGIKSLQIWSWDGYEVWQAALVSRTTPGKGIELGERGGDGQSKVGRRRDQK